MSTNIQLRGVTKVYPDGFCAVKGIEMDMDEKSFVIFLGPSGCGKTTTLRMIAGLESITEGEIVIDGKVINNIHPKDRDIAMVFQNYALYPHMTLYDNIGFSLKMRKEKKSVIREKVHKAARILDLESSLSKRPKNISGGQRQRVALGRAIVRNPKVFLLDEPLSNLDAKLRAKMRTELIELYQSLDATFIYVTHDQVEAMTMGTVIVLMNEGEVQQIDTPQAIYDNPANLFVATFIGSPQMNIGKAVLEQAVGGYCLRTVEGVFPVEGVNGLKDYVGKEILFGIRPEAVSVAKPGDIPSLTGTIKVVEALGAESYLHFVFDGSDFIVRVSPKEAPRVNEEVGLVFHPEAIYLFDKDTERRIGCCAGGDVS